MIQEIIGVYKQSLTLIVGIGLALLTCYIFISIISWIIITVKDIEHKIFIKRHGRCTGKAVSDVPGYGKIYGN